MLVEELKILPVLLKNLMDPDYLFSDQICTILSNLSRSEEMCKTVFKVPLAHISPKARGIASTGAAILIDCIILFIFCLAQVLQEEVGLIKLVDIFCTEGYNKHAKLNYLAPLLSNLTQLPEARNLIVDKDRCVRTTFYLFFFYFTFYVDEPYMLVCMILKDLLSDTLNLNDLVYFT